MAEESKGFLGGLFGGLKKKAGDAVLQHETALVRGKVAGRTVRAQDGTVIVEAGRTIDEATIQRAIAANRLTSVMQAVAMAHAQDLKEKASQALDNTEDGREARNVDSVDEYVMARRYVGRIAVIDVTDIRGNVIVPGGKEVNEEDVRRAREAGQLSALIFSAQQPQPPRTARATQQAPREHVEDSTEAKTHDVDQQKRATLPFVPPPGQDSK